MLYIKNNTFYSKRKSVYFTSHTMSSAVNSTTSKLPLPSPDLRNQQDGALLFPRQPKIDQFQPKNEESKNNDGISMKDSFGEGLGMVKENISKLPMPEISSNVNRNQSQIQNSCWFSNTEQLCKNRANNIPRSLSVVTSMSDKNESRKSYLLKAKVELSRDPYFDMNPPEPVFYDDPIAGKYGVRCVCGQQNSTGLLVQCDKCEYWLHGICVCLAKVQKDEPYFCPYCTHKVIRCRCNNNMRYDMPIVQCAQCKYWVHKNCENLKFGRIPNSFLCHICGGNEFILPHIRPIFQSTNKVSFVECSRFELIKSIPEGKFRDFVISDLNKTELHLHDTLDRYFHEFVFQIFEQNHEFWKVFIDSMVLLLDSKQDIILSIIDQFACSLIYKKKTSPKQIIELEETISESTQYLTSADLPKVTDEPKKVYLNPFGKLCVATFVDDEEFICELPGFIMHTDELNSDDGIPLSIIRIFETDLIVDLESTKFEEFAQNIQRSFHYNCYAKVYSDKNGIVKAGLFATRLKGPFMEYKKGHAINSDSPLYLPLDGEIPYPIPKNEWKSIKAKQKYKSSRTKVQKKTDNSKTDPIFNISLLSGFYNDFVPPLPINLVSEKEIRFSHTQSNLRNRTRSKHHT